MKEGMKQQHYGRSQQTNKEAVNKLTNLPRGSSKESVSLHPILSPSPNAPQRK